MYDLIIIGAGPAGLSAAIYAVRKRINVLVLASAIGGQVMEAHIVENYLGIAGVPGFELVDKFKEHARKLGIETKEGFEAKKITLLPAGGFRIATSKGDFEAKSLIVATGKRYRRLDVPGAREFEGKGITYCATCDAPLFKDKTVVVVGAGDAGQDTVWQLTKYASKIFLLNRYPELRGDDAMIQEQLKKNDKVEIINGCYPVEIKGDKFVKDIVFECNGSREKKELSVDGIFVEIGSLVASQFLKGMVELNEREEIIINPKNNMSSQPGIFAAGDVTDVSCKQIIIAAGEGAKAALSAYKYLKTNSDPNDPN